MSAFRLDISLRWRVFAATSFTITMLFAISGWVLQQYAIGVADESVRAEIQASIQAYEAVWNSRTRVLSATTALLASMSDVRAAFLTRDKHTIQDFTQEIWSRVPDQAATVLVLDAEGQIVSSLGEQAHELRASSIPLHALLSLFPKQVGGYVMQERELFYVVLTPVYVQTSGDPLLLNILCAGFRIDDRITDELHRLAPGSEFAFLRRGTVFASTLDDSLNGELLRDAAQSKSGSQHVWQNRLLVFPRTLTDLMGHPVAQLMILRPYDRVRESLAGLRRLLGLAWLCTTAIAVVFSLYITNRLLGPVRMLDKAATQVGKGDYKHRIPVHGSDELSRLAATFNQMCDSIEEAQADLVRREQVETIGRLGSSLVHDLRNPLAAIYGGAEMLVDDTLPPEHTRRIARNIYRASQRVQELLRDLLNLSRGVGTHAEHCRLRDVVDAAVEPATDMHPQVRIETEIDEAMELSIDRTRIERVFSNLITNAVEAMPEGGVIRIAAKKSGDGIEVTVADSGTGVPELMRSQLFRPFATGKRSGLGLGLTLCRQTMSSVGGSLELMASDSRGACFCVRFPGAAVVSNT